MRIDTWAYDSAKDELWKSWHLSLSKTKIRGLSVPSVYCFAGESTVPQNRKTLNKLGLLFEKAWRHHPASKYGWRVVHIETVLRPDLHSRFIAKQENIRKDLTSLTLQELQTSVSLSTKHMSFEIDTQKSILANHLAQTRISYHGTRATIIPEIVAHGILKPGSTHPDSGKHIIKGAGSTFGPGIYTSPNPHLALIYSSWEKNADGNISHGPAVKQIIVCATMLGRAANARLDDGWRESPKLKDGAHSHVANG